MEMEVVSPVILSVQAYCLHLANNEGQTKPNGYSVKENHVAGLLSQCLCLGVSDETLEHLLIHCAFA